MALKGSIAALGMMPAAATARAQEALAWKDPALVAEMNAAATDSEREAVANRRAKLLISAMSLNQKLQQLTGAKAEILPELPHCLGARHVAGIAALGIPTFRVTNGPVGVGQNDCVDASIAEKLASDPMAMMPAFTDPSSAKATALPSAMGVAASFDLEVASLFGEVIATEMNNLGLHVFEAPGVNLARLPVLGRNFEYFGEDPYLSGVMAVAETRAIQAQGLIAMPKHFAANEQETNRMTIQTTVDRQTMRELYLLPFEMAVKDGKAASVMCAYNYVNGSSSCESRELLTDVLRTDWGFTGYVQSDFFAMKSAVPTMKAGMDHEMPRPTMWTPAKLTQAMERGELTVADFDQALERRYTQAIKAGIFDRRLVQTPIDFARGGWMARRIGGSSAVLLQNNGALPLRGNLRKLVLIGKASQVYARQAVTGGSIAGEPMGSGGGSSDVVPQYTVAPVDGLRKALAEIGNGAAQVKLVLVDDENSTATIDGSGTTFAQALVEAASADAVVMMAGTISEEGADRATFVSDSGKVLAAPAGTGSGLDWYAPRSNIIAVASGRNAAKDSRTVAMIDAVLAARSTSGRSMAAKSVLVLKDNAGVALPAALVGPRGPAIVETWFPGQEDGDIVADVLFGRINPSGKLPVTFPIAGKGFLDSIDAAQFPGWPSSDGKAQTVTYSERLAIGYRWYDANAGGNCALRNGRNPCVAFPFGHGLSYTTFAVGKPRLDFDAASGVWRATARVTNTGGCTGFETLQAYISLPPSADAIGAKQPPKRLVGFGRIALAPGRSGEVTIAIDPMASNHPMSVWDESEHKWVVPAGQFTVWIGRSSSPRDLARAGYIRR